MKSIILTADEVRAVLETGEVTIRRPVDSLDVYKQTGCTTGKIAMSGTAKSWAVFNGDGGAHLCLFDCPFGMPGERFMVDDLEIETVFVRVEETKSGAGWLATFKQIKES